MPDMNLPEWASLKEGVQEGRLPVLDVDADGMYSAWLAELGVSAEEVDQYWLECAYQCGKLELQVAAKRPGIEIRIHDPGKKYAQKNYPVGHGSKAASPRDPNGTGQPSPDVPTAREQFKKARGFFPS